ncbi:sugar phosphate isomerase/epimerase [Candidatus Bathyarchaeota archaeon]|nr:sugar phosphate isomerase/epimerase [Candidatus Bathyarchaeota archaeon]
MGERIMEIGARTGCIFADTLEEKMRVLKDLGYDFLELPLRNEEIDSMDEQYMSHVCNLIRDIGFPIKSTGMSIWKFVGQSKDSGARRLVIERIMKMIDLSEKCGADVILLATCEDLPFNEYVNIYVEELRKPADYAEDRGITLALEHVDSYKPSMLERLVRAIDHDAVKVYFDIGNCIWQGEDPVEQIHRMADLIAQIHIKGLKRVGSKAEPAPLSQMPLAEVRNALMMHNYRGRGCLEIRPGEGSNEPLKEALRILRQAGY